MNNNDIIKVIENEKYKLTIVRDSDPFDPRDDDNLGKMITWCRHYTIGDTHNYSDPEEFFDQLTSDIILDDDILETLTETEKQKILDNNYLILPIYLYDHSGITINTTGFSCPWDSGKIGYIYISKDKIKKEKLTIEQAKNILIDEVKTYDQYLSGEIYQYILSEKITCECCKHIEFNTMYSCRGFYNINDIYDHMDIDDTEFINLVKEAIKNDL